MKTLIRKVYNNLSKDLINALKNNNAILAGGALERLAHDAPVNDYDVYFKNPLSAYNFVNHLKSTNWVCICGGPRSLMFQSNIDNKILINVITFKYFNNANEILNHFDFECCKAALDFSNNILTCSPNFWPSLQLKQLIYTGSLYPVGALIRMQKYIKRGYVADYASILKLFKDLKELKVDQQEILEEQIGGMYGLEFDIKGLNLNQIIEKLDNEIKIHKKGCIVNNFNIDEHFDKHFTTKKLDILIPNNFTKNSFSLVRYLIKICNIDGKDTILNIFNSDITPETETYDNITFPLITGKWIKRETDTKGVAYYKNNFIYELGKMIEDTNYGFHVAFEHRKDVVCYHEKPDNVWCEIEVEKPGDIKIINSIDNIVLKRGKVVSMLPNHNNTINNFEEVF